MGKRKGFTLIELLVVVGIIAVLIAILLPSLGKAKEQARKAVCLSNVRHIGMALQLYLADYKHMFPYAAGPGLGLQNPYSWNQLLMNGGKSNGTVATAVQTGGYGASMKMSICPDAPAMNPVATAIAGGSINFGTATTQWGNSEETGQGVSSSYGMNGWLYNPYPDGTEGGIITAGEGLPSGAPGFVYSLPVQGGDSLVPAFADCNWRIVYPKPTGSAGTADPVPASVQDPNLNPALVSTVFHPIGRLIINRHVGAINVSFIDGHAETVKLADVYGINWSSNWKAPAVVPAIPWTK